MRLLTGLIPRVVAVVLLCLAWAEEAPRRLCGGWSNVGSALPAWFEALFTGVFGPSRPVSRTVTLNRREAGSVVAVADHIEDLGPREVEILGTIASGLTTEAIAGSLSLSQKTIQNYHYGIKSKLNLQTDADLVWLAISAGLTRSRSMPG